MAPAVLISGSTGKTKTVVLSQYNIVNNLVDAAAFGDYQPEDQTPGILPLFRIFGQVLLFGSLILDYAILFPETVSADSALRCVEAFGVDPDEWGRHSAHHGPYQRDHHPQRRESVHPAH